MNNQKRLESIREGIKHLGGISVDNMEWLVEQLKRVNELEEKIKLERRLNKDLHKLQYFLQNNPELSKYRYGESISLIAIDAMELLQEENEHYAQALEFYGNEGNYKTVIENDREIKFLRASVAQTDGGEVARKALGVRTTQYTRRT